MSDWFQAFREECQKHDTTKHERDRLREALAWYADPTRYVATQVPEPRSVVHQDGGHRAREALAWPPSPSRENP